MELGWRLFVGITRDPIDQVYVGNPMPCVLCMCVILKTYRLGEDRCQK